MDNEKVFLAVVMLLKETRSTKVFFNGYAIPVQHKKDAEEFFRGIIHEFLCTPDGEMAQEDTSRDFNWGDVGNYVPQSFFAKYGVFPVFASGCGPFSMSNYHFEDFCSIYVNHDEHLE